jgi:leader peptidase (prepilin peptidase)/N-methyltransferase
VTTLATVFGEHTGLFVAMMFGLGLLFGSFLNVCIARWPARRSVVRPRSRCPRCDALIAWYDNIPVLSWLALRARCRHCRLPIPLIYPAVELITAGIWAGAAWRLGPSVEMLRLGVFFTLLLGIAMTDAREYLIPDEFSIGGTALGIGFAVLGGALAWPDALLGAAVGYLLLWLVAVVGARIFGEEAMGGGDIKMMAMLGAFLGWSGVLLSLFLGALVGTIIFLPFKLLGREKLVPFGIFLALGGAATYLAGGALMAWYWGMVG